MSETSASSGSPGRKPWGPQYPGWCNSCGGNHDPDPAGVTIDFKGRRFTAPFHCLCCDRVLCARQFAFGRCCGPCDIGSCSWDRERKIPRITPGHNLSTGHSGPFLKYSDPIPGYEPEPGEFVPRTAKLPRTP
ncbi:MAG: hypothetical protein KGJ23_08730 [Euryarchaeota archaeon]|nr:hypothetical protein [Euryarchaeota archaeon]MDE1836688.1 hypothetical protein [Euryarchaeota archaeon]MDE1880283.1 hypothetical protein [Euryarchaeota archaeon]MDE2044658.1 hypothetical protein [Thermoplasmata archaeon]